MSDCTIKPFCKNCTNRAFSRMILKHSMELLFLKFWKILLENCFARSISINFDFLFELRRRYSKKFLNVWAFLFLRELSNQFHWNYQSQTKQIYNFYYFQDHILLSLTCLNPKCYQYSKPHFCLCYSSLSVLSNKFCLYKYRVFFDPFSWEDIMSAFCSNAFKLFPNST